MICKDMAFPAYLESPGYGSSDVRAFKVGPPAMVPWRRANRDDGTASTRLGTAAHCLILTPDLFESSYRVRPSDERGDFRTKEGKKWRDDMAAHGIEPISADDWTVLQGVAASVTKKLPRGASLFDAEGIEWSVFWDCASGLPCKGRPDWFDQRAVYDLKVSIAADKPMDSMIWQCHANGWMNQLAGNRAGLHANGFRSVAKGRLVIVSPNAPHNVHLLEVRESDMDFLELDNENTRRGMMVCHRSGNWPGTPDTWQTVELPASAAFTESDLEGAEENPIA